MSMTLDRGGVIIQSLRSGQSGRGAGSGISWKDGVLAPAPDQQIKVKVTLSETDTVSTTGF